MKCVTSLLLIVAVGISTPNAAPISPNSSGHATNVEFAPPAPGKLYHGFYWGGVGTDKHDPTEHDLTPADVADTNKRSANKPRGFIFQITGLSLEDFQPRRVTGSAISKKFRISG
jgi:hypothetical protein